MGADRSTWLSIYPSMITVIFDDHLVRHANFAYGRLIAELPFVYNRLKKPFALETTGQTTGERKIELNIHFQQKEVASSVTRLGDFYMHLAANCLTKVAQKYFGDFLGYF